MKRTRAGLLLLLAASTAPAAEQRQDEKEQPWRPTLSDMRNVVTAISAYAVDQSDMRCPPGDYPSLKALLEPTYLTTLPAKDAWGTPYAYAASADGQHFRLVSAGADLKFEQDSLQVAGGGLRKAPEVTYRDHLEADIINEDGYFLQLPVQAKPK